MKEIKYPPLPDTPYSLYYEWPDDEDGYGGSEVVDADGYTANQLQDYARPIIEQRDELAEALLKVLDAHTAEAKASLSLSTAEENYSDHSPELDAYTEACVASSKAEANARAALAKLEKTS